MPTARALAGRTILEANLRQRFGVVVVGIQRANGEMEFNPPPESVMQVGDFLVVLGQAKNLRELEAAAGQPGRSHGERAHPRRPRDRGADPRVGPARGARVYGAGRTAAGPGIVLVGDDPSSEIYVRNKVRTGTESGLWVDLQRLPATATLDELLALVARLNASAGHDGILVQSPLPAAMGRGAAQQVFDAIDPAKDVDGFHPTNVGRLVQGRARLMPCTPSGIIELLERSGIAMAGAHAVVIGRSEIVGKPMAMLLLQRDATVTICHSKTPDLAAVAATADILVAAIGRPGFVTPGVRQAGRDGRGRRHHRGDRRRGRAPPVRARLAAPARTSIAADRSWSATCIPASRRWPAR